MKSRIISFISSFTYLQLNYSTQKIQFCTLNSQLSSKSITFSARLAPVQDMNKFLLLSITHCCYRACIFVFFHNDHKPPAQRQQAPTVPSLQSNKPFIYDHHLRGFCFDYYYIYLNPLAPSSLPCSFSLYTN